MAAVKPKGKLSGMRSKGTIGRPLKMVKMIQARCRICNPGGQGRRGWQENCPHDPYNHLEEIETSAFEAMEEQEDGTLVQKANPGPAHYKKVPNWKQIADDPKVASGRMIQIQLERGSKFPEEFGYAPICDYFNCWEPASPRYTIGAVIEHEGIQTVLGKYHTRDEAAVMRLRLEQTPIYVGFDQDIRNRRRQLNQVNLGGLESA
jgi:hypothetical protein